MNFEDWEDPNPAPVIDDITLDDGRVIHVVRDDLIDGGSKVRFVDFLIRNMDAEEIVFGGCPATGYAQMALPLVCKKYGKKATLFMAKRDPSKYTEYQKKALKFGANIQWVNMGMLTVTLSRARKYYEADKEKRANLPLGLEHPSVVESISKVCRKLPIKPTEIWSVGSSGTINRGMQMAWPDIPSNVVQVGHKLTEREAGRSKVYVSEYPFGKKIKEEEMPPFPSAPTYDAKGWKFVLQHAKDGAIFWNVGA